MKQFIATYKLFLQHQATKGKALLIFCLIAAMMVAGFLIRANSNDLDEGTVELVATLGLNFLVPVITLILASSSFGQLREDETLVYIWLKPSSRLITTVAALLASATIAIPALALSITATSLISSSFDFSLAGPTLLASILAVLAYSALFMFLGLAIRNSLIWGFIYIFALEVFIGNFLPGASKIAIKTYPASILQNMTGETIGGSLGDLVSTPAAIITLVLIPCIIVAATTRRLQETEVA